MASGASGVGEVRVMPDPLHDFIMAICRADGSSAEEARLVADHLVLANLFGHDSHGVGMMEHHYGTIRACYFRSHFPERAPTAGSRRVRAFLTGCGAAQPASLNGSLFGSKRDRKIAASIGFWKQ